MSRDKAQATVEGLIAEHIADTFERARQDDKHEPVAAQIRSIFTERFIPDGLGLEQDNRPPAIVELRNRIAAAFSIRVEEQEPEDRATQLEAMRASLESLRVPASAPLKAPDPEQIRFRLLLQRERLLMKNELSENFGRIEVWLLSVAFLILVFLKALNILWALPILGLSIARSWYLDRRCAQRLKTIESIDAVINGEKPLPRRMLQFKD